MDHGGVHLHEMEPSDGHLTYQTRHPIIVSSTSNPGYQSSLLVRLIILECDISSNTQVLPPEIPMAIRQTGIEVSICRITKSLLMFQKKHVCPNKPQCSLFFPLQSPASLLSVWNLTCTMFELLKKLDNAHSLPTPSPPSLQDSLVWSHQRAHFAPASSM